MTLTERVEAVNRLLEVVYGQPMRLSVVLHDLGFGEEQIDMLRRQHTEAMCGAVRKSLSDRFLKSEAWREFEVLGQRIGLDAPPRTLNEIGSTFQLSRERIRQLETRARRRCRNVVYKKYFEEAISAVARELLDPSQARAILGEREPLEGIRGDVG